MATNFLNFKKHAVAGSSKLKATTAGHIYNIQVADAELDNGTIVKRGALVEGTMDVYAQAAASANFKGLVLGQAANGNYYVEVTAADGDLLVLQVPMIYEEYTTRMQHESNFYNVQHDVVRAYELYIGDIFELSLEGFDTAPSIGAVVTVNASTKKLKGNA